MDDSYAIFRHVMKLSGLSSFLAAGTIRRSLEDVGASPGSASVPAWRSALVRMEARMRAYMPEETVRRRSRAISVYLDQQEPAAADAELGAAGSEEGTLRARPQMSGAGTR